MSRSNRVSVTTPPNQNKTTNILKLTYLQISFWINSFAFIVHIDIVAMGKSRRESVTPSQIRNETNNILDFISIIDICLPNKAYEINSIHTIEEIITIRIKNIILWSYYRSIWWAFSRVYSVRYWFFAPNPMNKIKSHVGKNMYQLGLVTIPCNNQGYF